MFNASELFDLSQTEHAEIFSGCKYAWEALPKIAAFLEARLRPALHNRCEGRAFIGEKVFIGAGTVVEDGGDDQRAGYHREKLPDPAQRSICARHVIIGDNCVVGNSTEVKNSVFFNNVQAPHFNYVGDSILGYKAHLGAGGLLSSLKLLPENITVDLDGAPFDTGLRKFGALLGDGCVKSAATPSLARAALSDALPSFTPAWPGAAFCLRT